MSNTLKNVQTFYSRQSGQLSAGAWRSQQNAEQVLQESRPKRKHRVNEGTSEAWLSRKLETANGD